MAREAGIQLAMEKIPPQNIEAEMSVLGSMLLEENAIARAIELLGEDCFYRESHRRIFKSILGLFNKNRAVDLVTLSEELSGDGTLEDIGGAAYLASLLNVVPTAANVEHYARIVKEKSMLRSMITAATQIISEGYEDGQDAALLLDKAERLVFEIADRKLEGTFVPMKEVIKDSIETIERLFQKKSHVTGIPTGFSDFDSLTSGLQPSDLIIIAGRPSMGKSAFMTCIAEHVGLVEKQPVAIFSLEMAKEQLIQRMLCCHARVSLQNVRTGMLSQSDWPGLIAAANKFSEAPIFIDDAPNLTYLELKAKARRIKSRYGLSLIMIDYLQLMQSTAKTENRQQEVAEISRSFKALAKELKVPLVAVSQLSRAPEKRGDETKPRLSDLRESGAIEQDADIVVFLYREEMYKPDDIENRGKAELIIAKQRNGPTDTVPLTFLREYTRFENYARADRED